VYGVQISLNEAEHTGPLSRIDSLGPGDEPEPESIEDALTLTTVEATLSFDNIGLPANDSWEWESVLQERF
jgi:hypothetical protein